MVFIRKKLDESVRQWELLYDEFRDELLNEQGEEEEEDEEEETADDAQEDEPEGDDDEEGGEEEGEVTGDEYEEHTDALYRRVQGLLNNDIFNHAAIVERLWGERDASARSRFRKKLEKYTTDDGYEYGFDRQELSDILAILGRAGSEAVSAYEKGRKKKRTPASEK